MQIVDFIRDNWQYFSAALVVVLEIVLLFLKRSKSLALTDGQIDNLIDWVLEAEKFIGSGKGNEKIKYVCQKFHDRYPTSNMEDWAIRYSVERILTTPQKKGVNDGKK